MENNFEFGEINSNGCIKTFEFALNSSNFEGFHSKIWSIFIKFVAISSWFDVTFQSSEISLSYHNLMNIPEPRTYDGENTPLGNRLM